jgi:hypothetical protein
MVGSAADMAVHGAGRVPEIDDLELEAAGVERGARGPAHFPESPLAPRPVSLIPDFDMASAR